MNDVFWTAIAPTFLPGKTTSATWYAAQPKERIEACNLCGGDTFWVVEREDRYGFAVSLHECMGCSLRFLSPRMTAEAYRDFYRDGYYRKLLSEFYGHPINAETLEDEQRAYAEKLIPLVEPHLNGHAVMTMLDVGGSTGVVAEAVAKHFDLEATVLEPSEDEGKRAQDRGLRLWQGCIEEFEPNGERFDLILLCQTIDHLLNIAGALKTIHALLEDDGLLFVDIAEGGPIKVDHPYCLDHATAADYLTRAGFGVLSRTGDADGVHVNFVCEGV